MNIPIIVVNKKNYRIIKELYCINPFQDNNAMFMVQEKISEDCKKFFSYICDNKLPEKFWICTDEHYKNIPEEQKKNLEVLYEKNI